VNRQRQLERWFPLSNPSKFLVRIAWLSAGAIVIFVAFAVIWPQSPMAWLGFVGFMGLLVLWFCYPTLVVVATAIYRPAPKPMRERNLFLARSGWLLSVFWGLLFLIIGGVVGGFVAVQLETINTAYELEVAAGTATENPAAPNPSSAEPPTLSNAAIDANIAFLEMIRLWISFSITVVGFLLMYVAPLWVAIELLIARLAGRRDALSKLFRVDLDRDGAREVEQDASRHAWVLHLSSWSYPAVFFLSSGFMVAFLLWLAVYYGVWGVFDALIEGLNGLRQAD
jgi:hypothetical protein